MTSICEQGGMFLVSKPRGTSSRKYSNQLKGLDGVHKIGHVGTLDPLASGLLLVVVNKACRLQNYLLDFPKSYSGLIYLGASSTTDDLEGRFSYCYLPKFPVTALDQLRCLDAVKLAFGNSYLQEPPAFSAKKVRGQKAYTLARQGRKCKIPSKKVFIKFNELRFLSPQIIYYDVEVSSGFYVRALARDIGKLLGVGGFAYSIHRYKIGPFQISQRPQEPRKLNIETLTYYNISEVISKLEIPSAEVSQEFLEKIQNGNVTALQTCLSGVKERSIILRSALDRKYLGIVSYESDNWRYNLVL